MDDDHTAETGSVSSQESYAFLNHSPTTADNNLPPDVDNKQLARQKRKRTSPEDQTVLEAAYKRDPKPDKTARIELVKLVALGEKEVQIWFQNRRQSSRRKSRPLLPHEVAQYQMSRAGFSASPPGLSFAPIGVTPTSPDHGQQNHDPESQSQAATDPTSGRPTLPPSNYPMSEHLLPAHEPTGGVSLSSGSLESTRDGGALALSREPIPVAAYAAASFDTASNAVGYLANRRSASSRLSDPPLHSTSIPVKAESDRKLKKSASVVRLSLNAEGNAEIVTKNASSPSPPRPQQTPVVGVSAEPGASLPFPTFPAAKGLQRSTSGRSRDSRSWEFWCDKEARSELGNAAAKDSTGSAAGAIGLLRTASGRNVLGALSSKRNSALSNQSESVKRTKLGHKRPHLQRSHTSLGRLQGKANHSAFEEASRKLKHSDSAASLNPKNNDSDKENWSPDPEGDDVQPTRERHIVDQAATGRRKLLARSSQPSLTRKRGQHSHALGGNDPESDAELAAFMGGSRKSASVSEDDDLDCVQGLLSLSQGNWAR